MIPETVTIPTAAIVRFMSLACPAAFLGWLFGIFTTMHTIRRAGYQIVWKKLGNKSWPVMEKLDQEPSKSD